VSRSVVITSSVYPYRTVLLAIQAITDREGAVALVVSRVFTAFTVATPMSTGLAEIEKPLRVALR
jgi:hypothetical protein